jgi:hypothetical protein
MGTKTIEQLLPDLEHLIKTKEVSVDDGRKEELIQEYMDEIEEALRGFLQETEREHKNYLRGSNIGQPARKLYYDINGDQKKEELSSKLLLTFLQGHVMEAVLLLLVELSGHTVEHKQEEVEVEGIKGHIDAVIDGVLIDVKTASPYSYQDKFVKGGILDGRDPFGYNMQNKLYAHAFNMDKWGWLAFNKASGETHLLLEETFINDAPEVIKNKKYLMKQDTPPSRCYPDKADGKSGNTILGSDCSYCRHKVNCWEGLRAFKYSNGVKYFTNVKKTPKVEELKIS